MTVENSSAATTITTPSDREIMMTRVFDAPRELVFKAWTEPEHLKQWWGPRSHEMILCEADLRPGGAYRMVLRGPKGHEYPFRGVYLELHLPERVVCTHAFDMEPWADREAIVTVTFVEHEGRTTMTSISLYPSVEDRDGQLNSGMASGAVETLDRLADYLQTME